MMKKKVIMIHIIIILQDMKSIIKIIIIIIIHTEAQKDLERIREYQKRNIIKKKINNIQIVKRIKIILITLLIQIQII